MTGIAAEKNVDRTALINALMRYTPHDETERGYIGPFLELLDQPRCFYRDTFPAHITGSSLLINADGDRVLMNHHKSLKKWLNFGGHADGDEDSLAVAIRETMEESGITSFKPLTADFIGIDIHPIPENPHKGEPAHFHYDVRYVMQMTGEQHPVISDESTRLQWMTFDEALALVCDNTPLTRYINKARALL